MSRCLSIGAVVMAGVLGASAQNGVSRATVTLVVRVDGFESADGVAGAAAWQTAQGFPEQIEHAVATTYVGIQDGVAVACFGQMEPGTYAITVFHDTNDNRRFDRNWLGMPREAWGVSNNVRPRLRAPRFDEAMLELPPGPGETQVEIHVR